MPPTGAALRGRAGPRGRGSAAPRPASLRRRGGYAPAAHSEPATRPCAAAASSADTCPHHSTSSGQLQPAAAKACAHTFRLTPDTAWLYRARSGREITHMCPRTAEPGFVGALAFWAAVNERDREVGLRAAFPLELEFGSAWLVTDGHDHVDEQAAQQRLAIV